MAKCTGPSCDRDAEVGELCQGHYMQKRRGRPLAPMRGKGTGTAKVVVAVRVSRAAAEVVGEYRKEAAQVVETWASLKRRTPS